MRRKIDIENWSRKEHFRFFNSLEESFFGVVVKVDVTKAIAKCKLNKASFYLYYLHCASMIVNEIEQFRCRIEGEEVWIYDTIHVSATVGREDTSFGFSCIKHDSDFEQFSINAEKEIKRIKGTAGLDLEVAGPDSVHYSALPWLDFTSVSHARSFTTEDSCPKISFGKVTEQTGVQSMPLAIHVHHGLMDGYHVGLFVEKYQDLLNR